MQFIGGFLIPLAIPLTAVGMVAADVKEHWLRSLLMRPVSRSEYLLARMSAVYVMIIGTILVAGLLPIFAVPAILGKPLVWMASRSIPTFVFLLGQAYLILVLLTFLSCWLPGILNIVMLGLWALGSSALSSYVRFAFWDNGPAVIAADFLFPSGFWEAAERASRHGDDPLVPVLWGLAAAVSFTALAFWSVNRVQVDGGSE
jgi:ABC-type transport system involved in multi-copper enzyme maturation permease subunit